MSHLNRQVKAAGRDIAEAAADISHDVGSVAHAVAENARDVAYRTVEAAEENCGQVCHAARDSFDHARDRAARWEGDFEK